MSRYASGRHAWGECARSGRKMPLHQMVRDGHNPELLVDPAWYEPEHPLEDLQAVDDPVALRKPSPRRDQVHATVRFPLFDVTTGERGPALFDVFAYSHDLAADNFKVALYTAKPGEAYAPDRELSAAGYTAGGQELALSLDGDDVVIETSTWPGVYFEVSWLLVYRADTGKGLFRANLGSVFATENGDFAVKWGSARLVANAGHTAIERVIV